MSRDIPLSALIVIGVQTVGFIWWLATLNATVSNIVTSQTDTKAELKVLTANVATPVALSAARIETLNSRLFMLEGQLREISLEIQVIKNEQARRTPYIPKKAQ